MEWSDAQRQELTEAGRRHLRPGVRVKALAVRAVAAGQARAAVAEMFATTRQSVSAWVTQYRAEGLDGLAIGPGRGRKAQVDDKELKLYAEQSPRQFGLNASRWTLRLLAKTVPSLKGFTDAGVRQALRRCGFRYKRGQPWSQSPDPDYEKKGTPSPLP